MSIDFKSSYYPKDVILYAVFFYARYGASYRDLEEIMAKRGIDVDHATLNRWVVKYIARYCKSRTSQEASDSRILTHGRNIHQGQGPPLSDCNSISCRAVGKTLDFMLSKWMHLYRAITKQGDIIDFYLSPTRNTKTAKTFPGKALRAEGKCPTDTGIARLTI